ncbi:MAG: hypothetical protein ACLQVI_09635 [Polyangiaceae bacterium]
MTIEEELLNGEVSRALTLGGLGFQTTRTEQDGRTLRLYYMAFEGPDPAAPCFVTAYVSGQFFIATSALRLVRDEPLHRLYKDLVLQVPMVRLVEDQSQPSVFWVEATGMLPPGPWRAEGHVLVSAPITVVASAVQFLMTNFRSDLEVPRDAKLPVMTFSVAAAAPTSRSSLPAAAKAAG